MKKKRTHLWNFHHEKSVLTTFGEFELPLFYKGIISEHLAVRHNVGLFDVTHMGRCIVKGVNAESLLDYLMTNKISSLKNNQGIYTIMCNISGGIIDDVLVFRYSKNAFLLIYNSGNRRKGYNLIDFHAKKFDVKSRDVSNEGTLFAVQGPKSLVMLQTLVNFKLSELNWFCGSWINLDGFDVYITRSGYTGEDGFEIYLWNTPIQNPNNAIDLWEKIMDAGQKFGCVPCGLGSRDSLRLEAGFCLYGNELNEEITPLEANLDFALRFDKNSFLGRKCLLKQKNEGVNRTLVAFRMTGSRIPRSGYGIHLDKKKIGWVTSGTFSPILKCGIGMGYVFPKIAKKGTNIYIDIRGKLVEGKIVRTPFYDTKKFGRFRSKEQS